MRKMKLKSCQNLWSRVWADAHQRFSGSSAAFLGDDAVWRMPNNAAVCWDDFSYTNGQSAGADQPWMPKQWFSSTEGWCSQQRRSKASRRTQTVNEFSCLLVNLGSRGVAVCDDEQSRSFASFLSQLTHQWAERNLQKTNRSEECADSKFRFPQSTV